MGTKELSYVAIGALIMSIMVSIVKLRPHLSVLQKIVINHARKAIFAEGLQESSGLGINFKTKPIGLSDTSNSSMPYLFILVFLAVIVFASSDNNEFGAILNVIVAATGIVIMVGFKFTEFVIQTIEQEARYLAELIDYVEGDDDEEDDLDEDDEDEEEEE